MQCSILLYTRYLHIIYVVVCDDQESTLSVLMFSTLTAMSETRISVAARVCVKYVADLLRTVSGWETEQCASHDQCRLVKARLTVLALLPIVLVPVCAWDSSNRRLYHALPRNGLNGAFVRVLAAYPAFPTCSER